MAVVAPEQAETRLRDLVTRLAAIERGSASPGERAAAELIADELRAAGAERVRLESERVVASFHWPMALATGLATAAGLLARRAVAAVVGAVTAAAVADHIRFGRRWWVAPMRRRTAVNVVGEVGPADAARTLVFVSHHDAAHSGLIFHPGPGQWVARRFPEQIAKTDTGPPFMWGAVAGPALVALGMRRCGAVLSALYTLGFVDIGLRAVVPGANDNATGCAVIVELARAFASDPLPDTRVLLVSTSEEAMSEGMCAFARRHFASLPRETTTFVAIDTVGAPRLLALEGEGFLGIFEYPKDLLAEIRASADELGIELVPNLRTRTNTDGVIPLRAGYRTASIASVDEHKLIPNYHWPTDTADRVDYGTVAEAYRLCERFARRGVGPWASSAS